MKKKKLLCVDDDKIIRDEFVHIFQNSDYILDTASNSTEGQSKILNAQYDLAMLDIRMPNLSHRFSETAGLELLDWIKSKRPQMAVIMLTALNEVELAVKSINSGAKDYLTKDNFETENLVEMVGSVIENNEELNLENEIENILKCSNNELDRFEVFKSIQYPIKTSKFEKALEAMSQSNKIEIQGSTIRLMN